MILPRLNAELFKQGRKESKVFGFCDLLNWHNKSRTAFSPRFNRNLFRKSKKKTLVAYWKARGKKVNKYFIFFWSQIVFPFSVDRPYCRQFLFSSIKRSYYSWSYISFKKHYNLNYETSCAQVSKLTSIVLQLRRHSQSYIFFILLEH